jgi:putative sigma-54 modulation protein
MKLTVTGRHLTVSEGVRTLLGRKLTRLERLLNDSAVSAQCIVGRDGQAYVCELTVHARGDHMLHAVGRHARLPSAITAAVEKAARQAQRVTERWKARRRKGGTVREMPAPPVAAPVANRPNPRVIRLRDPVVKPMTLDDAILALSESDRPVLVFRQAASEAIAILYRRPDGHYGLIEPGV